MITPSPRDTDPLDVTDEVAETIAVDLLRRYGHPALGQPSTDFRSDAYVLVNRIRYLDAGLGRSDRRGAVAGILLAALSGAIVVGLLWAATTLAATPRSAQTTPLVDMSGHGSAGPIGAPPSVRDSASEMAAAAADLPSPASEIAAVASEEGTATWCAPTPKYCQSWGRPRLLGAVESFRWGDTPYRVRVHHGDKSVVVTIVSYCRCGSTLIDLSVAAFEKLAPLSRGRIDVTITEVGGLEVTVPPTEAQP